MTTFSGDPFGTPNPYLPVEVNPPEDEDTYKVFLIDTIQKIIDCTNNKQIGIFYPTENFNGQIWNYTNPNNPQKFGYRTIIYVPPDLPNVGSMTYPHNIKNINSNFAITNLYAAASNTTTMNYRDIVGDNCTMDNTNVTLTTTFDGTGYQAYIVIEYLRNI